jgi:hypothetical protein
MTRNAASAVIRTDQFDNANSAIGVAIFHKAYHDRDRIRSFDLCGSRQAQPFENRIVAGVNYDEVLDVSRAQVC